MDLESDLDVSGTQIVREVGFTSRAFTVSDSEDSTSIVYG